MTTSKLDQIAALVADTTGWLEWISPRATTEIAVVYADGDVYLPTGGTAEEFAFANARGKVHRLVRADDLAALLEFAIAVEAAEKEWRRVGPTCMDDVRFRVAVLAARRRLAVTP